MKYMLLFLASATLSFQAISQKVEFFDGSWEQANARAALENKYIIVDAYTEWCGWCKVMEKETFCDSAVASFINTNFVPLRIDFEDSLGVVLSMKFRVWAYPTTMVFNPKGQLVGKISGYNDDNADYISDLQKLLDIKAERVFDFDSRELDLPWPEFYRQSFVKGYNNRPDDSTVTDYLAGQDDLFSEVNWSVILRFSPGNMQDHVLSNREEYARRYGKEEVSYFIQSLMYRYLATALIKDTTGTYLQKAIDLCGMVDDPELERNNILTIYYTQKKNWTALARTLEEFIGSTGYQHTMNINNNCWAIYENVDDPEILNKATSWMAKVIEAEPIWMFIDTYAALLYKSGRLEDALKYADLAIAAGIEEGEDVKETRDLREKIIKAMESR